MKEYRVDFKRTTWGYFYCEAESEEEAKEKILNNEAEIFDNKSEEEYDIEEIYEA